MINQLDKINVVHVKLHSFLPSSETFVFNRVINPICKTPVNVITDEKRLGIFNDKKIKIYEINKMPIFIRHAEWKFQEIFKRSLYIYFILKKLKPDIIHSHFSFSTEACIWASKKLNIPHLASFYGVETKYEIYREKSLKELKRIYRNVDRISCLSLSMYNDLLKTGCPIEKLSLIRLGVDTNLFKGKEKSWDIDEQLKLISIARLHPEKGLEYLIKACDILQKSGFKNWDLKIIGTGFIEDKLKGLVTSLSLNNKIHFLGSKSPLQVVEFLKESHLLILPSLKETQGVVLQEAQATSTPVIASNVGGIPEGILNGKTGFLIPAGKPEEISKKIKYFIKHPILIKEMGNAGVKYIKDNFSRDNEYFKLSELYNEIIYQ
jgi:colanic acid/amylovoran biosynthesis glycosyltransferase